MNVCNKYMNYYHCDMIKIWFLTNNSDVPNLSKVKDLILEI